MLDQAGECVHYPGVTCCGWLQEGFEAVKRAMRLPAEGKLLPDISPLCLRRTLPAEETASVQSLLPFPVCDLPLSVPSAEVVADKTNGENVNPMDLFIWKHSKRAGLPKDLA